MVLQGVLKGCIDVPANFKGFHGSPQDIPEGYSKGSWSFKVPLKWASEASQGFQEVLEALHDVSVGFCGVPGCFRSVLGVSGVFQRF